MSKIFLELDAFKTDGIHHGFFGRKGGESTDIYASLNCGLATDDPHAMTNRGIVARAMGGDLAHLASVYQIHSANCVYVDRVFDANARPRADAMVTDVPGVVLGVLTADCGPILFQAQKEDGDPIIAAAHAGWKGALAGVLDNTVQMMVEHGALLNSIVAAVGPCIVQKSYEVSLGFETPFLERDAEDDRFFKSRGEKLMFDLPGYIAKRLAGAGVARVILSDVDTLSNESDYFSYRRTTLSGERDNGRQISAIVIPTI